MTQDQYGQPRNPGYVVRGEVVQDDESGVAPAGQAAPMTRFQKVAPAARPDQPDSPDAAEDRAVSSPDAGHDYWDDDEGAAAAKTGTGPSAPAGQAEEPAGEAPPDGHDATHPSMTQPGTFAAPAPPSAAAFPAVPAVPTVPIAVAAQPAGDGERPAEPAAAEAEPRPGGSGTKLAPGESGYASLIPDTADLRAQWHRIQYAFVDDPRVSVTEAADVIAQVAARLEAAIAERQRGLRGRWDTSGTVDTETLRETLRMYRSFLDQLIGAEPS